MSNQTKCEGCAFSSGTAANRSQFTLANAKLCVETRTPFYCHEAPERLSREGGFTQGEAMDIINQSGGLQLCGGYVEAVKLLTSTGFYEQQPEWKTGVNLVLMNALDKFSDNPKMTEQEMDTYLLSEMERLHSGEQL